MKLTSRDSLDLLDNDRQGPSIAQLRPKWQFALKVWKKGQKLQNFAFPCQGSKQQSTG